MTLPFFCLLMRMYLLCFRAKKKVILAPKPKVKVNAYLDI